MKNKIAIFVLSISCFTTTLATNQEQESYREIIGSGIIDVNRTRKFTLDTNSTIYLDQVEIDIVSFEIIGSGFKSKFTIIDDAVWDMQSGTINTIELITNIKGPITSLSPFMVLDQEVLITSDTVKDTQVSMALGDTIAISGYLSLNNSLKATKIMQNNADWKIRGYISSLNPNKIDVGNLSINYGVQPMLNCGSGLTIGTLVEVKMSADLNYTVGTSIDTMQSVECLERNPLIKQGLSVPSVVQGYISQSQGQNIWLDDIKIITNNDTVYVNGEKDFIDTQVNVEVLGVIDTLNSEIIADAIRFIEHRIEITFPVEPQDIVVGESITILGTTYYKTPQTKDNANILSAGIAASKQIKLEGFVDSEGKAYITKILNQGAANYNHVSIRGDIKSLNNPTFGMLNVTVDATNSLIIKLGTGTIDVNTFFSEIEIGSQIEIKNAHYDLLNDKFTDGKITIRKTESDNSLLLRKEIIGSGFIGGFGMATITATANQIFVNGFE